MKRLPKITLSLVSFVAACLTAPLAAQDNRAYLAPPSITPAGPPAVVHLTLEEAKQRALANNKLLNLAGLNADGKAYAVKAARSDYFPKVVGTAMYFHFNDDLGTVLSTQGRTVSGPRGRPLVSFPATTVNASVLNQDSSFATIAVVQPLTDLLKVRQGVKIARADEQIARAQLEKGIREVASGVEQLYWGLLAVRRLRAGAAEGLRGAELLAKGGTLEGRTALVEARQAVQQVEKQNADLEEQLNGLLDLPLCTHLELAEPPLPVLPFRCVEDVIGLALATSPDVHAAQQTICKAQAAVAAGKLDYVPSVALVGGYANQTAASYIQQDIGYIGVMATYTFVDWGKRRNIIHERQTMVAMATLKLRQTEDDVRQKAVKAYREVAESLEALRTAEQMVELRREAEKRASTPEAERNPAALLAATGARMAAEVEAVKADLAYRQAHVQVMSMVGQQ